MTGNTDVQVIRMDEQQTVLLPYRRRSWAGVKALAMALPQICRNTQVPLLARSLILFAMGFLPLLFVIEVIFALPFLDVYGELTWIGLIAGNVLLPLVGLLSLAFSRQRPGHFLQALTFYMLAALVLMLPLVADIVLPLVRRFGSLGSLTWQLCAEAGLCWMLTVGLVILVLDSWRRYLVMP
jgi:hypothetical protein